MGLPRKRSRVRLMLSIGGLIIIIITAGAGAAYNASSQAQMVAAAPPPTPVKVARAAVLDVPHVVEVVGTVDSLNDMLIRSQVEGVLTAVNFEEGDLVRAGALLATIDDRPYRAALAAAKAQLARDRALLAAAERELARAQALQRQNVSSVQTVDQRSAEVEQLRATVALNEANVESAEVNLSFTKIYSPTTGRAGLREVDPGNLVRPADAHGIASIVQMDPISVVFTVPQQILAQLKEHARLTGVGASPSLTAKAVPALRENLPRLTTALAMGPAPLGSGRFSTTRTNDCRPAPLFPSRFRRVCQSKSWLSPRWRCGSALTAISCSAFAMVWPNKFVWRQPTATMRSPLFGTAFKRATLS